MIWSVLSSSHLVKDVPVASQGGQPHLTATGVNFACKKSSRVRTFLCISSFLCHAEHRQWCRDRGTWLQAWRQANSAVPLSPHHQHSLPRTCRALAAAAAAHESDPLESVEEAVSGTSFDVATAIALAGCAFESYNEPRRVSAEFQERTSNGTVTTYIER